MSSRRASITARVMRTTILTSFLASQMVPGAMADPSGGNVVAGQGLITQSGRHTQIDQSSDRLIIEWDNFDTSAQESVRFAQPGRDAMALNRVLSGQATRFDGSLFANGNIVIVNGAGIHFGPTSVIDVGGLIASTSDITNSNFLSNRLIFDQPGRPDAMVTNAGDITIRDAGLAALVAPGVENSGLIRAELGTVILASGETHTIDFRGDGLISFAITSPTKTTPKRQDGSDAKALVTNSGTVEADGGSVVMTASQASRVLDTAINMKGVVRANSVGVRNGKIVLGGGSKGRVRVAGKVRARGTTRRSRGGTVHITGESVATRKAQIDVSGAAGGGKVLIGGAARGGALEGSSDVGYLKEDDLLKILVGDNAGAAGHGFIPTARDTSVDADSVINASATEDGDGGLVILWANQTTRFAGSIVARGGPNSGDGGFVETSGAESLGVYAGASVDALALNGAVGDWLLDPRTVIVRTGGAAGLLDIADATDTTSDLIVDPSVINGAAANVSIVASETIRFDDAVAMTNAGVGLTALAGTSITVDSDASVTTNNGAISFISDNYVIGGAVNAGTGTIMFDRATAGLLDVGLAPGTSSGGAELDTNELALLTAGNLIFGDPTAAQNQVSTLSVRQFPNNPNISGLVQFNALDGAGSFLLAFGDQTYPSVEFNANDGVTFTANATVATTIGNATFNVDADGTGVVGGFDNLEVNDGVTAVVNSAADILVNAPDIRERGTGTIAFNAAGGDGTITIQRSSAGTIGVGGGNGRFLQFSDAQLARLTAGTINFGNPTTPNNTTAINVNAADLSGTANTIFNTAGTTTFSGLSIFDSLSVDSGPILVNGATNATGTIDLTANSPITFAANLTSGGNITATANDTGPANADNITVNAGVTVQSTGGNVTLNAGDDVILSAGATVSANGTLNLTAGHNDTDGDGGLSMATTASLVGNPINLTALNDIALGVINQAGSTVNITSTGGAITDGNDPVDGTLNITAQSLSLSAATGIGGTGPTATIETQVSNLEARTTTGGIFIDNTGDLTIGGVTGALNGVQVVTSGDIELTNAGSIDINVADENVVGPAAVTVIANGATADILTGTNAIAPNAAVQSSGGTVTLRAGQDLLLGDPAGAGTLGNVFGGGSVVLDAGRDIIVDTGTFVQASGAGTITANAGRNISVIDTSGPFAGAEIRTEGGDITLTTGAGGVFTANNGASPAVNTTVSGGNGNITINADAMDIQNSVSAGTGIVTLQTVTNGQLIDLGTETAGSLSLTDAELDQITASTLRIGSTDAGSIDLTAAISPANTGILSLITGDAITDNNAAGADITVANLAMQAVNGIGSANTLELGVGNVAAANSTSGSIALSQLTGLGDLTVGTVDGVVGVSNQATTGLSQTRIQTQASSLIINDDIFSALDALLVGAGGSSLLDNNATISTGGGFGIDLQASSMALEGGTVTAGSNGRVRINPVFVGQAVDLGSTSDAAAALELSDAELDTITAGTLQIGQSGIGDITITDAITLTNTNTLDLVTSGAVLDNNLGTDITVDNLAFRTAGGVGTAGDAVGLDVNNLAFANTGGVVNLSNLGDLTITAVDGVATSSNTGTTTTIATLGASTLTFAVDTSSTGNADFTATAINVNNGVTVDSSPAGTLAFNAPTVNLDGNLSAVAGGIGGTATTVNVLGSTGGAEIQDAVDVATVGATVNVGDGTFTGGILIDKALTMLGDGFTATTTVNVADNTAGMTVNASNVIIDGFQFTGDGSPTNATGILVDGSGSALANILIGDANTDTQGSRFTGLTTGLQVADGGTGNAIGIEIGLGNVFDTSTDGIVLDGAGVNLTGDTFNNVSFAGITDDFIRLENGAAFLPGSPTVLDATAVTFDGVLGGTLSFAQALAVENKLVHYLDDPTLGLLNIGQLVVANGNSIQLAVNAAGFLGGPQTVTVDAGTFGGSVEVWVDDLTLNGQGATTIIDTDAIDAFANNGDADNGFQIAAISALSGGGDVTGVIIDGFSFDTVTTTGSNIGVELGEAGTSTAIGATVRNSTFNDLQDGIFSNLSNGTTAITGNTLTAIDRRGINFDDAVVAGEQVNITGNNATSGRFTVTFDDTVTDATVQISGNTLASTTSNDAIIFDGTISNSNVTIGGAAAADANDISGFQDGIDVAGIVGGTFSITGNTRIVGGTGDGIEFEGPVNGAVVNVTNNTDITGAVDGIFFESPITNGATVNITGNTGIVGAGDGLEFADAISNGSDITISGNERIEGLGTFADEDGLGDGIAFRGAISDVATTILIDDNTLIRGDDRGINFADATTGGPATVTDASITISRNDEIRGTNLDSILFNADLANATILIGGPSAADGNGLIIGNQDGLDNENVIGGSFTVANNGRIEGATGDSIEFEGQVSNGAQVTISGNTTIEGLDDGVIFEDPIRDSTIDIAGNAEIRGGGDGISIFDATDSTINVTGNTGIFGDGADAIFVQNDLTNSDVSIDGNETVLGAVNGVNVGAIVGGSFAVANNGLVRGTIGDGIITGPLAAGADVSITDNIEIRGDADGIAIFDATDSTIDITGNTGIFGDGFDAIFVLNDLTNSAVSIDGNETVLGAVNGVNVGAIVGGSFAVANNGLVRGTFGDGIITGPVAAGADVSITDNTEIRGDADGIAIFDATDSTINITGNTGIFGDGFDAILVFAGLTDTLFNVSENGEIVGFDDGMNIDFISGGSFMVSNNTSIRGVAGSGMEFEGPVTNIATFVVDNNTITGGEEAIEFDTPATITDSTLTFTRNTLQAGTDGLLFAGQIRDSTIDIARNSEIRGGANGISIFGATDSTINVTGNTGIFGDGSDAILVQNDLTNSDVSIDGNETVLSAVNGVNVGAIVGGSFAVANNGPVRGTTGDGIITGPLAAGADVSITDNTEIRGDADGIAIFDATDSTINITGNTGIFGDGSDAILVFAGLTDSTFTVSENGEIVGLDDGMNIDFISGGSFMVSNNTSISGGTGSGMEFVGPVTNVATFVVDNNTIRGGEEAIEFDTPATITDSTLSFTGNTLQAGTDGLSFDGRVMDSTVTTARNTIVAGENGISFSNLARGSSLSVDASDIVAGQNGLAVTGSNLGGGNSFITLGQSSFRGERAAGISITSRAGGSGITTQFDSRVTTTGSPALALSGPNQAIAGNDIGNVDFNSVGGGNFITLSNGALFEPGRPTIVSGLGASFDGIVITPNVESQTIDWVESRIIDFDDNATLGQIFFFNLPFLFDNGFEGSPVRLSNVQTPGDWILRPDFIFQILATNPLIDDYGLGTCLFEISEESQLPVPRCVAPAGEADPSPSILRYMEGMEQLSALQ